MPIPDEEMVRLCREAFGAPLDAERRSRIAAQLASLARVHLQILETLDPESEPAGHTALLREVRREG